MARPKLHAVHYEPPNQLLLDKIHTCFKRNAQNLRELEAYKLKLGFCIGGFTCTRRAVKGPLGGKRYCAEHQKISSEGLWGKRTPTAYGMMRKQLVAEERAALAAEEKRAAAAAEKKKKPPAKKRAA